MKHILLTIAIAIITTAANAQDWKEYCVTSKGDTLRIGDKLVLREYRKLEKIRKYEYVKPSKFFPSHNLIEQQPVSSARYVAYLNYLHTYLKNDTVTITRFTRWKDGKNYSPVAVFEVQDKDLSAMFVEYTVEVNGALEADEINLVR